MEVKEFSEIAIRSQYYGLVCASCVKRSTTLKSCGKCHRAYYCNAECQLKHWKTHKPICKTLCKMMDVVRDMPIESKEDRLKNFDKAKEIIDNEYGDAQVKEFSYHWFLNDWMCSVCYKSPHHFGHNNNDWYRCPKCRCGWCCSEAHWNIYKSQHTPEICQQYQESFDDEMFLKRHQLKCHEEFMFVPEKINGRVMKSFSKTWDEYYGKRSPEVYAQRKFMPRSFFACATRFGSQVCSVVHAIDETNMLKTFNAKKTLQLHVVGAAPTFEWPPTSIWEEIVHIFPNLMELDVLFVGPLVKLGKSLPNKGGTTPAATCPNCTINQRIRKYSHFQGNYFDYKSSYHFRFPDLCVAFNTELSEVDFEAWEKTIETMLQMGIPCILTSYDETGSKRAAEVLKQMKANIIMKPKENPFRCQCFVRNPEDVDSFFQINAWILCFKGFANN